MGIIVFYLDDFPIKNVSWLQSFDIGYVQDQINNENMLRSLKTVRNFSLPND